jgi:hypothetical protein
MNIYIAGGEGEMKRFSRRADGSYDGSLFKNANILQSFYYADDFTSGTIIPNARNFLLDSGAFTFMNSVKSGNVDFDSYCDRYIDFINANKVQHFFELDIDSVVGLKKVEQLRSRIERRTGKQPIVVWHKSRGKQSFIDSCKEYPYVALGGIVAKEITQKDYKHFPWFIDKAHEHGAKIHALGLTALTALPKYHFDSVDSTAWVSGNRFGGVYMFNGKTMVKHNKKEGQRIGSHKAVAIHNFREWLKFQEYARTNL